MNAWAVLILAGCCEIGEPLQLMRVAAVALIVTGVIMLKMA